MKFLKLPICSLLLINPCTFFFLSFFSFLFVPTPTQYLNFINSNLHTHSHTPQSKLNHVNDSNKLLSAGTAVSCMAQRRTSEEAQLEAIST